MSLAAQVISTNKNPTSYPVPLRPIHLTKPTKNYPLLPPNPETPFPISRVLRTSQSHNSHASRKFQASSDETYSSPESQVAGNKINRSSHRFDLDDFLSLSEFISVASSAVIAIAVCCGAPNGGVLGSGRILLWQCVFLASGACVGAVIRRRQWMRINGAASGHGADLLGRVEKLEQDQRGSATIVRVLSRHIEKLGIRVQAFRNALKEPISETAALAQKTSEVTRTVAAQEDILEKELVEIQKVLMAMQEQQQKQLELILAVGRAAKLLETKRISTSELAVDGARHLGPYDIAKANG